MQNKQSKVDNLLKWHEKRLSQYYSALYDIDARTTIELANNLYDKQRVYYALQTLRNMLEYELKAWGKIGNTVPDAIIKDYIKLVKQARSYEILLRIYGSKNQLPKGVVAYIWQWVIKVFAWLTYWSYDYPFRAMLHRIPENWMEEHPIQSDKHKATGYSTSFFKDDSVESKLRKYIDENNISQLIQLLNSELSASDIISKQTQSNGESLYASAFRQGNQGICLILESYLDSVALDSIYSECELIVQNKDYSVTEEIIMTYSRYLQAIKPYYDKGNLKQYGNHKIHGTKEIPQGTNLDRLWSEIGQQYNQLPRYLKQALNYVFTLNKQQQKDLLEDRYIELHTLDIINSFQSGNLALPLSSPNSLSSGFMMRRSNQGTQLSFSTDCPHQGKSTIEYDDAICISQTLSYLRLIVPTHKDFQMSLRRIGAVRDEIKRSLNLC